MRAVSAPIHDANSVTAKPSFGTKSLAFDHAWSQPAVSKIETMLQRFAAFPEVGTAGVLNHEFIFIDPSAGPHHPGHQDMLERLAAVALRLSLPHAVIAHHENQRFDGGGFSQSVHDMAEMDEVAFAGAFATLRERLRWVLSGSRFNQRRHLVFANTDGATLAAVVELMAAIPVVARPFVHLISRWDETAMPNQQRFGSLERYGHVITQLNTERPTVFVYGWSKGLANALSRQMATPVQALDPVPELSLRQDTEVRPERFTVGFFGAAATASGFDHLAAIVQAANRASMSPGRTRFVVQAKRPGHRGAAADMSEVVDTLRRVPERNVVLVEDNLPRHLYYNAVRQVDAVLLPYPPQSIERYSSTAVDATVAGKLILTLDGVLLAHVNRARVVRAANPHTLGEILSDLSSDVAGARAASRVARDAHWAMMRPARLFAQLLYGPLILAKAEGHETV